MIEKYYKTLNILRYQKGGFGVPSGYQVAGIENNYKIVRFCQ